jgi:hypothetical protein
MSTQRRANCWQRVSCTDGASALGLSSPGLAAQIDRAPADSGTASPETVWNHPSDEDLSLGAPVWLATNSLQLDYRIIKLDRQGCQAIRPRSRSSSPPPGAKVGVLGGPSAHGLFHMHIPSPPRFEPFHRALP